MSVSTDKEWKKSEIVYSQGFRKKNILLWDKNPIG